MTKMKFLATSEYRVHIHRPAYKQYAMHGDTKTLRVRGPIIMENGDVLEMDQGDPTQWDSKWCLRHYPKNFVVYGDSADDPNHPDFNLDACTYPQLKAAAAKLDIPRSGTADEIRAAIRAKQKTGG